MICNIPKCNRKVKCRSLCASHYGRWQRLGDNFDRAPIAKKLSFEERFKAKIGKKNKNGCMLWNGAMHETGYGKVSSEIRSRYKLAHRVSYELFIGKIPKGLYVCHTCDVRDCVNPKHLFIGTHIDNMKDRDKKGRNKIRYGIDNPSAKINEDQVREIRSRINESRHILAKEFNITPTNITSIQVRRIWKHVE